MRNDDLDLRADRDELHDYAPRAPQAKRQKSLVLQVALGVFLGGLALWLVQLGATAIMAKLAMGTFQVGVFLTTNCGWGIAPFCLGSAGHKLTDTPLSGASPLPHLI